VQEGDRVRLARTCLAVELEKGVLNIDFGGLRLQHPTAMRGGGSLQRLVRRHFVGLKLKRLTQHRIDSLPF
jgi:hypothetical protein